MEEKNPYAAPTARPAADPAVVSGTPAERGDRLAASMIDGIVTGLICFPVALYLIYPLFTGASGFEAMKAIQSLTIAQHVAMQAVIILISSSVFLLLNFSLLRQGQTIGKRLMKLRIVSSDGASVTRAQLLKRYGFMYSIGVLLKVGMLINLLDSLLIFRTSRRCLHDSIADTIVVRA